MLQNRQRRDENGPHFVAPGEMVTGPSTSASEPQLVLSDDVVVESADDDRAVLANLETADRVQVSASFYSLLLAFRQPRRVSEVVPPEIRSRIEPQLARLLVKHILINFSAEQHRGSVRLRHNVAHRFCNAPAFDPKVHSDFIIIGLPCDLVGDSDSRLAPEEIRRKSLDFPFRRGLGDNTPRGWFDADRESWLCEGFTLADAGDIHIEHGEDIENLQARVQAVLEQCASGTGVPIVLGGDDIAAQVVATAFASQARVTVVRLTGEAELSFLSPDTKDAAAYALSTPIDEILAVEKLRSSGSARAGQPPPCTNIHLSIDLGIAAAAYRLPHSAQAAVLASLDSLKATIAAIGSRNKIIGIDFHGLDMRGRSGKLGAALACQLALTAMEATRVDD